MALTPSGAISMSDINSALGRSSTASISFNDSQVRFLANQDTGSVNMNAMRNKYNFNGTITVGAEYGPSYIIYGYAIPGFTAGYGSITGTFFDGDDITFLGTVDNPLQTGIHGNPSKSYPNITMRLKVGSNQSNSVTRDSVDTYVYRTPYNEGLITSSMDGTTVNWQFSQA